MGEFKKHKYLQHGCKANLLSLQLQAVYSGFCPDPLPAGCQGFIHISNPW